MIKRTAIGSLGSCWSGVYVSCTLPAAPLQSPTSGHRLAGNMIRVPPARITVGWRPPASSVLCMQRRSCCFLRGFWPLVFAMSESFQGCTSQHFLCHRKPYSIVKVVGVV